MRLLFIVDVVVLVPVVVRASLLYDVAKCVGKNKQSLASLPHMKVRWVM